MSRCAPEARLSEKAKPRLDRLLFNLGDGVFGFYDRLGLKVYASTLEKAAEVALQFHRYVRPPAQKKPGFHLLRIDSCYPKTESVPVKHFLTLSVEAAQLHYGENFIGWEQD